MSDKVRIGVVGTSWWADAMYLPALTAHPLEDVRGVVGARPAHTREFADRWGVPGAYDTLDALLAAEPLDALDVLAAVEDAADLPVRLRVMPWCMPESDLAALDALQGRRGRR